MATPEETAKVAQRLDKCISDLTSKQELSDEILRMSDRTNDANLTLLSSSASASRTSRGKAATKSGQEERQYYQQHREAAQVNIGLMWTKINEIQTEKAGENKS